MVKPGRPSTIKQRSRRIPRRVRPLSVVNRDDLRRLLRPTLPSCERTHRDRVQPRRKSTAPARKNNGEFCYGRVEPRSMRGNWKRNMCHVPQAAAKRTCTRFKLKWKWPTSQSEGTCDIRSTTCVVDLVSAVLPNSHKECNWHLHLLLFSSPTSNPFHLDSNTRI